MPNFHRQLAQSGENLFIDRFWSGEVTQRSALFTPLSQLGLQIVSRHDTLFGGSNMELSNNMTLQRRPGFSKFSTAAFGGSDYPLAFSSFKNLSGTINLVVDTPTMVAKFDGTTITSLYSKGTTAQTAFQKVGSMLYMCDGTNAKKWDGTTVSNWGIVAPVTAPTQSTTAGSLSPTSGYQYVYSFKNSSTGHVSTSSPVSGNLGAQTNVNFSLGGDLSADAQVDKIEIFRTEDGGSLYYFLTDITNIPAAATTFTLTACGTASAGSTVYTGTITGGAANALAGVAFTVTGFTTGANNGTFACTASTATTLTLSNPSGVAETHAATAAGTWQYTDSTADSGLNTDIVAPISDANDPPPANIHLVKFHMGRMFVAANNYVYFAGGPDTTTGVPEEAFPPANLFKFPDKVTALASTTNGLLVFTSADAYVILGTDTADFYSQLWQKNFGVQSQNCVAQDGDLLFIYTSKSQLFQIGSSMDEIGFPVGDQLLTTYNPATSILSLHRNGTDVGLFISDGSANLKKYNLNFNAWSPTAQPVGGIGAIASIETSTASYNLLMGRPTASGYILKRDTSLYTDDGTTYTANAIIGTLTLAPPGQLATIGSVQVEAMPVGTYPTVSVLLNEISGSFIPLPNPANDPPQYDGTAFASTTVWSKRHYLKSAAKPLPTQIKHLQIKVSFAAENAKGELLGVSIQ